MEFSVHTLARSWTKTTALVIGRPKAATSDDDPASGGAAVYRRRASATPFRAKQSSCGDSEGSSVLFMGPPDGGTG